MEFLRKNSLKCLQSVPFGCTIQDIKRAEIKLVRESPTGFFDFILEHNGSK